MWPKPKNHAKRNKSRHIVRETKVEIVGVKPPPSTRPITLPLGQAFADGKIYTGEDA